MTSEIDSFDLRRFADAQSTEFDCALAEINAGRKTSHWMWYIFPQFAGLGMSAMSQRYAIKSLAEARAYLDHATLGPRLVESAEAALAVVGRTAREIFGSPDDMKLRSCATLFARIEPPGSVFERLLVRFFEGERDPATERLLAESESSTK